ncbi:hypothetical protein B0H13DRAFT_1880217 [Mycena leptocephala]|nr:hypothetical protein B0H13DRAFT_1880217 [Mycena leptocephala]
MAVELAGYQERSLQRFHPGTVERRVLAPPAPLGARLALPAGLRLAHPAGLRLQSLRLGAQLAGTPAAPAEIFESASGMLDAFPGGYDPTSWRRWVVGRPWYCVEWTCTGESGTGMDGTLSVKYGEHYFRGFERGARRGLWMRRYCDGLRFHFGVPYAPKDIQLLRFGVSYAPKDIQLCPAGRMRRQRGEMGIGSVRETVRSDGDDEEIYQDEGMEDEGRGEREL